MATALAAAATRRLGLDIMWLVPERRGEVFWWPGGRGHKGKSKSGERE